MPMSTRGRMAPTYFNNPNKVNGSLSAHTVPAKERRGEAKP
jgi:hypothetical protein